MKSQDEETTKFAERFSLVTGIPVIGNFFSGTYQNGVQIEEYSTQILFGIRKKVGPKQEYLYENQEDNYWCRLQLYEEDPTLSLIMAFLIANQSKYSISIYKIVKKFATTNEKFEALRKDVQRIGIKASNGKILVPTTEKNIEIGYEISTGENTFTTISLTLNTPIKAFNDMKLYTSDAKPMLQTQTNPEKGAIYASLLYIIGNIKLDIIAYNMEDFQS